MGPRRGAEVSARAGIIIFRKCRRIGDSGGCSLFLESYLGMTRGLS